MDHGTDQLHPRCLEGRQRNPDWAAEEWTLRDLRPLARAVIPIAVFNVALAKMISYALIRFDTQVAWLADLLAEVVGDGFPHNSWFMWLLGIVWTLCLIRPLYRLLELKTTSYEFTNRRLRYTRGILNRQRDQIELVRVRDLTAFRSLMQRLLGIGTLRMETVDRAHPIFNLKAQRDVYELKDWIHELNAQERARLGYREYEGTQGVG